MLPGQSIGVTNIVTDRCFPKRSVLLGSSPKGLRMALALMTKCALSKHFTSFYFGVKTDWGSASGFRNQISEAV